MGMEFGVELINRHESCLLITGETHEWEFVEYVNDASRIGFKKALIATGHTVSEEGGMEYFCDYLREKAHGLSIAYIETNDLFNK